MLISDFLGGVRSDFRTLGELGGEETLALAERLGAALEPSLQKRFLDALNNLVQEYNLDGDVALSLNFEGDNVRFTRLVPLNAEVTAPPVSDYSARIALRLTDDLKEDIEHLATDVGSSVNSWIVRTLERSVRHDAPGSSSTGKRQLRGKGRA
jgi:hypothetical protein